MLPNYSQIWGLPFIVVDIPGDIILFPKSYKLFITLLTKSGTLYPFSFLSGENLSGLMLGSNVLAVSVTGQCADERL